MCIKHRTGKVSFCWLSDQNCTPINLFPPPPPQRLVYCFPIECWIALRRSSIISRRGCFEALPKDQLSHFSRTKGLVLQAQNMSSISYWIEAFTEKKINGVSVWNFSQWFWESQAVCDHQICAMSLWKKVKNVTWSFSFSVLYKHHNGKM